MISRRGPEDRVRPALPDLDLAGFAPLNLADIMVHLTAADREGT